MRWLLPFAVLLVGALDAPPAAADCTCRAQGRAFELGESACIATPNGPRRATCGMAANVTSWKVSGESCVVAQAAARETPRPAALARSDQSRRTGAAISRRTGDAALAALTDAQ